MRAKPRTDPVLGGLMLANLLPACACGPLMHAVLTTTYRMRESPNPRRPSHVCKPSRAHAEIQQERMVHKSPKPNTAYQTSGSLKKLYTTANRESLEKFIKKEKIATTLDFGDEDFANKDKMVKKLVENCMDTKSWYSMEKVKGVSRGPDSWSFGKKQTITTFDEWKESK